MNLAPEILFVFALSFTGMLIPDCLSLWQVCVLQWGGG